MTRHRAAVLDGASTATTIQTTCPGNYGDRRPGPVGRLRANGKIVVPDNRAH
jgi:hypothetical protein